MRSPSWAIMVILTTITFNTAFDLLSQGIQIKIQNDTSSVWYYIYFKLSKYRVKKYYEAGCVHWTTVKLFTIIIGDLKKRSGIMTDLLHSQFKKKPEETVSNRESSADKCLWIACWNEHKLKTLIWKSHWAVPRQSLIFLSHKDGLIF